MRQDGREAVTTCSHPSAHSSAPTKKLYKHNAITKENTTHISASSLKILPECVSLPFNVSTLQILNEFLILRIFVVSVHKEYMIGITIQIIQYRDVFFYFMTENFAISSVSYSVFISEDVLTVNVLSCIWESVFQF